MPRIKGDEQWRLMNGRLIWAQNTIKRNEINLDRPVVAEVQSGISEPKPLLIGEILLEL